MKKTVYSYVFDGNVNAGVTDLQVSPAIPNGKIALVKTFGGCSPEVGDGKDGIIALQWGNGGTYTTIRAGTKEFDFVLNKEFVGDGTKNFRLARINPSTSVRRLICWLEILVR